MSHPDGPVPGPPGDPRRRLDPTFGSLPADSPTAPAGSAAPAPSPFEAPSGPPVVAPPDPFTGIDAPQFEGVDNTVTVEDRVQSSSLAGRLTLVALALLVVAGAGFAVTRALAAPAGAASPREAADSFFAAVDNDDILGIIEQMPPSERASMIEPGGAILTELERLGVIEVDPNGATELDMVVDDLQIVTTTLGPGVASAEIVGGTITTTGDLTGLVRVGEALDDLFPSDPDTKTPATTEILDFGDEPLTLGIVEEDGSWYVSLWYTVAELARADSGAALPEIGGGPVPVGASTPAGAVQALVDEAASFDLAGVISMVDPEEFRALYDYSSLFLADAQDALDEELATNGVVIRLERLDAEAVERRGRQVVVVDGIEISATDGDQEVSMSYADGCFTVIVDNEIDQRCDDDLPDEVFGGSPFETSELGATVVERDGRWYVSGMPTVLYGYADILAQIDRADVDAFVDTWGELLEGLAEAGMGGLFSDEDAFDEFDEDAFDQFDEEAFDDLDPVDPGERPAFFDVDPIDAAFFQPEMDLFANDPSAYFGFSTDLDPVAYTSGWTPDFDTVIDIARFAEGSGSMLIADLEADQFYEPIELPGLPDDAVAFTWPDVDYMVVRGDVVVSTWSEMDLDVLLAHVQRVGG